MDPGPRDAEVAATTSNGPPAVGCRLEPTIVRAEVKCRCGTRLGPGESGYEFREIPEGVRPMLEGMTFCGPMCARAHLLEMMAVLETPGGESLLRDVRDVYWAVQAMFLLLDNQMRRPPAADGPRHLL